MAKKIVLSGMRPTGRLHLGNFAGALSNWIKLQNQTENQCLFMVADWHALTTDYEEPSKIESNIQEMVLDWLAVGLDPKKTIFFRQSWVKEHSELALILSMITPLSWLERNPTYKEQIVELEGKALSTHGFLGYPVLQAADILLYGATHVPVGEDQLPHLELTREIARRFNYLYKKSVFVEPQALLSHAPKVSGTDGRKMSKSYGNIIEIAEEEGLLKKKIQTMFTDPLKIKANDPGHPRACEENPKGCSVFSFHEIYEETKEKNHLREKSCKEGSLGCVQCKNELFQVMNQTLKPLREKRSFFSKEKGEVNQILNEGSNLARSLAGKTLTSVREAIQYHEAL
ncbi:MAG: tryptophan--tRNA ligase [Elusimicrobia bacterium]|nr:tryptophan--tRNA ligase [Elusimicrobiota bacterium]